MSTNQAHWQRKMREEGRCPHCGVKLVDGEKYCAKRKEQKRLSAQKAYNRQKGAA